MSLFSIVQGRTPPSPEVIQAARQLLQQQAARVAAAQAATPPMTAPQGAPMPAPQPTAPQATAPAVPMASPAGVPIPGRADGGPVNFPENYANGGNMVLSPGGFPVPAYNDGGYTVDTEHGGGQYIHNGQIYQVPGHLNSDGTVDLSNYTGGSSNGTGSTDPSNGTGSTDPYGGVPGSAIADLINNGGNDPTGHPYTVDTAIAAIKSDPLLQKKYGLNSSGQYSPNSNTNPATGGELLSRQTALDQLARAALDQQENLSQKNAEDLAAAKNNTEQNKLTAQQMQEKSLNDAQSNDISRTKDAFDNFSQLLGSAYIPNLQNVNPFDLTRKPGQDTAYKAPIFTPSIGAAYGHNIPGMQVQSPQDVTYQYNGPTG